jgi:phosphotransferase system  glucose/maltose/N-acetylglucosamine-specific IIC component
MIINKLKCNITNCLAMFWSVFSAGYISFVSFLDIPKDNVRFVDTVLGFLLGTVVGTIITYYMGNKHDPKKEESKDADTSKLQTPGE